MLADAEGVSMLPETTDPFLQEEARMSEAGRGNLPAKTQGLHLLGCYNKMPQPGWLEQCQRQGGPRSGCWPTRGPSKSLLPVFLLLSPGRHTASSPVSFHKDLNPIMRPHAHDLMGGQHHHSGG